MLRGQKQIATICQAFDLSSSLGQAVTGGAPRIETEVVAEQNKVVDWQDALDAVNGDRQTLQAVVDAYLEESPQLREQMQQAIESQDAASLERAAHTLKGSLRFFGAQAAGEIAWQLETIGKNGDLANAPDLMRQLEGLVKPVDAAMTKGPGAED